MGIVAVTASRWAAFQALRRVEQEGAFAADLLHAAPDLTARRAATKRGSPRGGWGLGDGGRGGGEDRRDAALAEALALGVLRWQGELDHLIAGSSGLVVENLDVEVRLALRLGAYQLGRLDRVPARAAVSESVEIVRRARKSSAAGLVNAVLRKIAARPERQPPAPERCVPGWMLERWRGQLGPATADGLALATLDIPPTYVRLNARFDVAETLGLLERDGVDTEATEVRFCRLVRRGRPERSRAFRDGRARIQDIGSQRVVPRLELRPGDTFLDLCAAPGGKTSQALEQSSRLGRAVAADLNPGRLLTARRLATVPVPMAALDATRPLPFRGAFDRILLDAPCSGTGTLARNPEIKWRLRPGDIEVLARRQRAMLGQALALLAPGGRLVYATCSLEPEENEAVVETVVAGAFRRRETHRWLPTEHAGDGFFACVITRQ